MSSQYTLEQFLYIHTDAELIRIAGEIIGTHKLNLSVEEAIGFIRNQWR